MFRYTKSNHICAAIFTISLLGASLAVAAPSPPAASIPRPNSSDRQAIEALLASYTRCLNEHDEAGFRALLLDTRIPFADVKAQPGADDPPDLHHYEAFRQAVFTSGLRYRQRFYDIHIEQHGPLAQVSLVFVTEQLSGKKKGSSTGWKVLQLVKVGDRWKIASELFTF
jgi:hypothetical protein